MAPYNQMTLTRNILVFFLLIFCEDEDLKRCPKAVKFPLYLLSQHQENTGFHEEKMMMQIKSIIFFL